MNDINNLTRQALEALNHQNYGVLDSAINAGLDINFASGRDQWTLLHKVLVGVSKQPEPSVVECLIQRGADVNVTDSYGMTPLHYAARVKSMAVVKLLIEAGADLNCCNNKGLTPLHQSIVKMPWDFSLIELFIRSGADPYHECNGCIFMNLVKAVGGDNAKIVKNLAQKYAG